MTIPLSILSSVVLVEAVKLTNLARDLEAVRAAIEAKQDEVTIWCVAPTGPRPVGQAQAELAASVEETVRELRTVLEGRLVGKPVIDLLKQAEAVFQHGQVKVHCLHTCTNASLQVSCPDHEIPV